MNALASLATMVVPVSILLKVIDANVPLDLLDCNVMKRIATVIKYHLYAQNEQCAETSQDLETSVAYADQDTRVSKFVWCVLGTIIKNFRVGENV